MENEKIDPILSEDYFFCKKTFESALKSPYVLDWQIQEKLKTLQLLIENPENSILIKEIPIKFEHLTHLDKISCLRLYIDTITCLFPRKNSTVSNYTRKGIVFINKRGGLRNWKKQLIVINVQSQIITLSNEISELEREIPIRDIQIEWVGFKKGKHCFQLKNLASRNPLCHFLLGHQQFNCVREWYELILDIQKHMKDYNPQFHKLENEMEKSMSENELEKSHEDSFTNENLFGNLKKTKEEIDEMDSFHHLDDASTNVRTEEIVREYTIPQIFQENLKNFSLENLLDEEDYDLVFVKKNVRILKNNNKPTVFKIFFQIDYPLKNACDDVMEIKSSKHWNQVIQELKVLNVISDGNESFLIHEKHKPFGKLYYPRDFCYLQSFVRQHNILLTLKKSINYPNQDKTCTRGNFTNFIEALFQHPKSNEFTLGVLFIDIDNSGRFLRNNENTMMTLKYLKQYKNLNSYLAHKNFVRSISKNLSQYQIPIENSTPNKLRTYSSYKEPNPKENSPKILFNTTSSEVIAEPLTPTLEIIVEEEKNNEVKPQENSASSLILKKKIEELSALNTKGLNIIYEKSEESKSYDLSNDKVLEKDIEEVLIKDTLTVYKDISPRNSKFPKIDRSDYMKLLEVITSNEHSIRAINKRYILHPVRTKEKFQSIYPEHYIFNKDWVKLKEGGLSYHNKKNVDNQKKVAGYLLKKIGKNLLTGKSIMNISMPIDIFDTTSFLERIAYSFTNIPIFLEKAAKTTDIIQQMNYVCAAFISTLHMSLDQIKPFNPILGETFQAWIKGSPLYLEQICHHPPISAFQLYGNGYILQGNFEVVAELHANSLTGKQLGLFEVILKNQNRRFYFTTPLCDINGGFAFGTRYVNYEGKSIVFNKEQCLMMELNFNPDKKGFIENLFSKAATPCDYFSGSTYKVTEDCMKRLQNTKQINKFSYKGINKKTEIVEEINKIRGIWHEYLMIDDKKYWDLKEHVAYELEYETDPLPSDSVYREDANVWKSGNIENGQLAKEKLEEIQRADRRWRAKLGPKKKGH